MRWMDFFDWSYARVSTDGHTGVDGRAHGCRRMGLWVYAGGHPGVRRLGGVMAYVVEFLEKPFIIINRRFGRRRLAVAAGARPCQFHDPRSSFCDPKKIRARAICGRGAI